MDCVIVCAVESLMVAVGLTISKLRRISGWQHSLPRITMAHLKTKTLTGMILGMD